MIKQATLGMLTFAVTYVSFCYLFGCNTCEERWPDGSCADDSGPVMAEELHGVWCQEPDERGEQLCLSVSQSGSSVAYTWGSWHCQESGFLTGGLEFTPIEGSCLSSEFYSASVDWTQRGIAVYADGYPAPFILNYQP